MECRSDEVDAAYDILAEELVLKDQNNEQDLIDFENVEDDDVETMLNNLKKMGLSIIGKLRRQASMTDRKGDNYYDDKRTNTKAIR